MSEKEKDAIFKKITGFKDSKKEMDYLGELLEKKNDESYLFEKIKDLTNVDNMDYIIQLLQLNQQKQKDLI